MIKNSEFYNESSPNHAKGGPKTGGSEITRKEKDSASQKSSDRPLSKEMKKASTLDDTFVLRYNFATMHSKFTAAPAINDLPLTSQQKDMIESMVKVVLKRSGIKKAPCWLTTVIFIFITLLGFVLGYLLIVAGWTKTAGIVLITTPLVSFFIVIGYTIVRGTQIERFENWWRLPLTDATTVKVKTVCNLIKGGLDVKREFEKMGLTIYYSFSEGKRSG